MDEKYLGGHNTKKMGDAFREQLSMKPSEYLDRNCFFAASTPGVEDIDRRHEIGIGNLLWGNDFPHPEGTFPYTRELVRRAFKDVPRDESPARSSGSTRPALRHRRRARWPRWSSASARSSRTSTARRPLQEVPEDR